MTAMISDSPPAVRGTVTPWPRSVGGEPAEPNRRGEELTIAVAYAVLSGAMVAQGRLEEAWRWLRRAERTLQPGAEPGIGMRSTTCAGLISEIVDLLAQPGQAAPAPREPARPRERLTRSETRVLRYLPTHLYAPEIAGELGLSVNTVKTHLRHLYQKLGARSRGEAVERARAFGLLAPSPTRLTGAIAEARGSR